MDFFCWNIYLFLLFTVSYLLLYSIINHKNHKNKIFILGKCKRQLKTAEQYIVIAVVCTCRHPAASLARSFLLSQLQEISLPLTLLVATTFIGFFSLVEAQGHKTPLLSNTADQEWQTPRQSCWTHKPGYWAAVPKAKSKLKAIIMPLPQ